MIIGLVLVINPSKHLNNQVFHQSKNDSITKVVGVSQAPVTKQQTVRPVQRVTPVPATVPSSQAVTAVQPIVPKQPTFSGSCSAYTSLFEQYDWNVGTAEAICQAESGGNPNALSPTCDRGLMQVNCVHADMVAGDLSSLYTPSINVSVAYRIYSAHGWTAWSTFNSGAYLAFAN